MIDSAVRAFLLAISAMITSAEPAADAGGGVVRIKGANVCILAQAEPLAALQFPEPHPAPDDMPPSASPTADRAWLVRTAVTSQGLKVTRLGAGFVDVRIFQ